MNEKPILFSGEMVRAILCGLKTQTRRIVAPQPDISILKPAYQNLEFEFRRMPVLGPTHTPAEWGFVPRHDKQNAVPIFGYKCPYGTTGDLLWVRETFALSPGFDSLPPSQSGDESIWWKASTPILPTGYAACHGKWRPSIHMPRWASRLTLHVKNIHIERLQEITDEDALKEGVDRTNTSIPGYAKTRFQRLWDSINKNRGYGWDANPWVWVIEFKRQ